MYTRKTKGKEFRDVPLGTFWGVVGILVAFMLAFFALWVSAEREIRKLQSELSARKANVKALKKALEQDLPSDSNKWEKYHEEHPIQFYITDYLGKALSGVTVIVARSGEQVTTKDGGLTPTFWVKLGDKVSIEKIGFRSKEVLINKERVESRVMSLKLRRIKHGKE